MFPLKGKALCEFELHGKQSFGQNSWYTTIVYVMAQWSPGLWFEHIRINLNHCLTLIAWLKATISVSVCTYFKSLSVTVLLPYHVNGTHTQINDELSSHPGRFSIFHHKLFIVHCSLVTLTNHPRDTLQLKAAFQPP